MQAHHSTDTFWLCKSDYQLHLPSSGDIGKIVLNHSIMQLLNPNAFPNFPANSPVCLCLGFQLCLSPNMELQPFQVFTTKSPASSIHVICWFLVDFEGSSEGLTLLIIFHSFTFSPLSFLFPGLPEFFFLSFRPLSFSRVPGSNLDSKRTMMLCRTRERSSISEAQYFFRKML